MSMSASAGSICVYWLLTAVAMLGRTAYLLPICPRDVLSDSSYVQRRCNGFVVSLVGRVDTELIPALEKDSSPLQIPVWDYQHPPAPSMPVQVPPEV
eukprot:6176684-Pleurochrysis_carterae.AAC.2